MNEGHEERPSAPPEGAAGLPTTAERKSRGRAARKSAPLAAHADWAPGDGRPDPIALLAEQAKTRVPELVPIRYGRMLVSPFAFYRGAAVIMAHDLASTPRSGLDAQLCGDAHVSNFGIFASPERNLVFDINDFDETSPGPFEWDIKRLAASLAIIGRERGIGTKGRATVVRAAAGAYGQAMRSFARVGNLAVWYSRLNVDPVLAGSTKNAKRQSRRQFDHGSADGEARNPLRALEKLRHAGGGEPRLVGDPPLLVPVSELVPKSEQSALIESFRAALRSYRHTLPEERGRLLEAYRLVDAARKVVGVGSVGTWTWVVLLVGLDDKDPLFLQFKEADYSVLEPLVGRARDRSHGERVVEGQRLMQAASDILLGWDHMIGTDGRNRDYYVRQLWDGKRSLPVENMSPKQMQTYAAMCGWTLARAHARSGDRVAIAAYLGKSSTFDEAIGRFAEAYADQNGRDYEALVEAVKKGEVKAETGV